MVEAWILVVFCLLFTIPAMISETRQRKKISQREKYDAVVRYMIDIYTQHNEIPDFMNRRAFYLAHKHAVQIAQEGKLDTAYKMIMRGVVYDAG